MSSTLGIFLFLGLSVLLILVAILYTVFYERKILKVDKNQIFEFKSSMDLIGLPVIIFHQGKKKFTFLIDTGSNVSYVNGSALLDITPVQGEESFIGANGIDTPAKLGAVKLYYKDKEYEHIVRIADLQSAFDSVKQSGGIELSGIIGNDFMEKYKYCIDFKELIVYTRT